MDNIVKTSLNVKKWMTKKKYTRDEEELLVFREERKRREEAITSLQRTIFETVAQHLNKDVQDVVEGYLDSSENVQILNGFLAKHGALHVFFSYGLLAVLPDTSGRYDSLTSWHNRKPLERITLSNKDPSDLHLKCALIYRVDNTEEITLRNYRDYIYSRSFEALKPDETLFTRFVDDFEGIVASGALDGVQAKIESVQKDAFAKTSLSSQFMSVLNEARHTDVAMRERPVFEIDQNLFKGFLITDIVIKETATKLEKVAEIENVLRQWMTKIRRVLAEDDQIYGELPIVGPLGELHHWKSVHMRCSYVEAAIQGREFRSVLQCLTLANSHLLKIKEWKEMKNDLSNSLIATRDINLFLQSVAKYFDDLHKKSPEEVLDQFTGLLKLIKSISVNSQHYQTPRKICKFIGTFVDQMAVLCKNYIEAEGPIWLQERSKIFEKIDAARHFLNRLEEKYNEVSDWHCSTVHTFLEKKYLIERMILIEKILQVMEKYSVLDRIKISTMEPFARRLKVNFGVIIASNPLSPIDKKNKTFLEEFENFMGETRAIEMEMSQMITELVEETQTVGAMLLVVKKYEKYNLECLCMEQQYASVAKILELEVLKIHDSYIKTFVNKDTRETFTPSQGISVLRAFLRAIEENVNGVLSSKSESINYLMEDCLLTLESVKEVFAREERKFLKQWNLDIIEADRALKEPIFAMELSNSGYIVNFRAEIYQGIRESDKILKLGLPVPELAKVLLASRENLLQHRDALLECTKKDRGMRRSIPRIFFNMMTPWLRKVDRLFRKGQTEVMWMSNTLPSYIEDLNRLLDETKDFLKQISDRTLIIEEYLEEISNTFLAKVPEDPIPVEQLKEDNFAHIKNVGEVVMSKSAYMEKVVIEMINKFCHCVEFPPHDQEQFLKTEIEAEVDSSLPIDKFDWIDFADLPRTVTLPETDDLLYRNFDGIDFNLRFFHKCCMDAFNFFYDQLLSSLSDAFQRTIVNLKEHITKFREDDEVVPIIAAKLNLEIPTFILDPPLDTIREETDAILNNLKSFFVHIISWGFQAKTVQRSKMKPNKWEKIYSKNVYNFILEKIDVSNSLTTFKIALRKDVEKVIEKLKNDYEYLWDLDREDVNEKILDSTTSIIQLQEILDELADAIREAEVKQSATFDISPVRISIDEAMKVIVEQIREWREELCMDFLKELQHKISKRKRIIRKDRNILQGPMESIEDISKIVECINTVNSHRMETQMCHVEATEIIKLLSNHVDIPMKNYSDKVTKIEKNNEELMHIEGKTRVLLQESYEAIVGDLEEKIQNFSVEWDKFEEDFEEAGILALDVPAKKALDHFFLFSMRFDEIYQLYETNQNGQKLFGMPIMEVEQVSVRKKQLESLKRLYSLYRDALNLELKYRSIDWLKLQLDDMNDDFKEIQIKFTKLPSTLHQWNAYDELKKILNGLHDISPLLDLLHNPSIQARHWENLSTCLGVPFHFESPEFTLGSVLDAPILEFRDQVEDICIAALKEEEIKEKLGQIDETWSSMRFPILPFKERGNFLLKGMETQDLLAQLDDTLLILNSLAANRYNEIFLNRTQLWIAKLTTTSTNLDMWLQVQNLWLYLEAVFVSKDISRQLPLEAKLFATVDMRFSRIVVRAFSIDRVVECCTHPELQFTFPKIMQELEQCLKSLSSYLEKKRKLFPRFYFVSDRILIEILGQSSNPKSIQTHLLSLFDGIAKVIFGKDASDTIEAIVSSNGETVPLATALSCTDGVEMWLGNLLKEMQTTIRVIGSDMAKEILDKNFDFIRDFNEYTGQMGIVGLQIFWTYISERALGKSKRNSAAMKETNVLFLNLLNQLIEQTALELTALDRTKYEAMITIHLHQRDIFRQLCTKQVNSIQSFDWQKQQRFYHIEEDDAIVSKITNVSFNYQNEYLGVTDRLVITPLTDRCYITLAQAISLNMGGAPAGPAGTGKTETTKDMGKSLGKYVVVFNCSDQMDFRGLGQIFKGLSESGSWGCFDEFNRIELSVLSVAAQQISILLKARAEQKSTFTFSDGDSLKLNAECGLFITMNPGYAGRQELPENLKVMFRNVAMMVPDRQIIIRVKLASCGFKENIVLARKFFTLYKLCENQLSHQIHYDFGLRNILSVLRTLGLQKRANPGESESATLMRVLRDMNLSKLIAEDKPIFISLVKDIFHNVKHIASQYPDLQDTITKYTEREKLINTHDWNVKVQQLYETCLVRHGIMVMGESFTGKSTAMEVLLEHFAKLGQKHQTMRMNPKAITAAQMFGRLDVATNEWTDGIFSVLFRKIAKAEANEHFWLILDGPVDTLWIENLNSVLDDSKILTLANGDRINMPANSKLVFEAENVDNASPATVSRLGMVYFSSSVLQWTHILSSWQARTPKDIATAAKGCLDRAFGMLLEFVTMKLSPRMQITDNSYAKQCTEILDSLIGKKAPVALVIERLTIYAIMWSLGALLDANERKMFQKFIQTHLADLPWPEIEDNQSIFDFFVNKDGAWDYWGSNIPDYVSDGEFRFTQMIIPNVESLQMSYLLKRLWKKGKPVLLIGEQGTGKTTAVQQFMGRLRGDENMTKTINFSYLTTPFMFQEAIQGSVDKRTGIIYGPPGHKKLTLFIDDLNIPMINEWGDQTTNEIVRQLLEFEGFYSLAKPGTFTQIQDVQFLAAMNNPGGGKNDIPNRLKRQFSIFSCTLPSDDSIDRIYKEIAKGYFLPSIFTSDIVNFLPTLVMMTRKLWQITKDHLHPSPAKFHYIFNLRDISRIWQGILQIEPQECKNVSQILQLWLHETRRVISDRCINTEDRQWFIQAQKQLCEENLQDSSEGDDIFFANFLRDIPIPDEDESEHGDDLTPLEAPRVYEPVRNIDSCMKKVEQFLEDFNEINRGANMNLILFREALEHLIIISRIINMEKGNALLIGISGYGKQSLTKLACFIAGYEFYQINLTTGYSTVNLLEDIKEAYTAAGLGKGVVFLFKEADVVDETFLDYINNLLTSGEILNLFAKEDYFDICNKLSMQLVRSDRKADYTVEQKIEMFRMAAKKNFHLVLCFSPIGTNLRGWTLKFPGLLSGCTIDWFQDWPENARLVITRRVLEDLDMVCEDHVKDGLIRSISEIHGCLQELSEEYFERFRRNNYIMPKTFRGFLDNYRQLYVKKRSEIEEMSKRMSGGIQKLLDAADSIEGLKVELLSKEKYINQATQEAQESLEKVEESTRGATEARNRVMEIKMNAEILVGEIEVSRGIVEKKLEEAEPALEEAAKALQTIKAPDIAAVRKLMIPPYLVKLIMDCVLIYLNEKLVAVSFDKEKNFITTSYKNSQKVMSGTKFLPKLRDFKTDRMNAEMMDLLVPYLRYPTYNFANAKIACGNVAGLLSWTQAMVKYYAVNKEVLPLKASLKIEEAKREVALKDQEQAEVLLQETEEKLAEIQEELKRTMEKKELVLTEARECKNKLDAASQLISGLGDEKIRWSEKIEQCTSEIQMLVGDIFYMSGFLTYSGAFNEEFRTMIKQLLSAKLAEYHLPHQEQQNLVDFFIDPSVVSQWLLNGLPQDDYSIENAILVTQSNKFPLLIDPQAQGVAWIEEMEEMNELIVLQQNMKNFQLEIENAIQGGRAVLLSNVEEKVDPSLTNILNKNLMKSGTTFKVLIAGKEVPWNENFRLYIATKMENPHFSPELSAMVNIVDFKVTRTGLENQLLSRIIRSEEVELEQERIALVEDITNNMRIMEKLERDLLEKLSSIKGSILDDVSLLEMLNNSKTTSIDIREKLVNSSNTEKSINKVREEYRPIAKRGSILYSLLSTLPKISHMYQTSLAQFFVKVDESLVQSHQSGRSKTRIESVVKNLTLNVFKYQSRCLYEQHRYSFVLLMALQIDLQQGKIHQVEYEYLLKAGSSIDASVTHKNPFTWLSNRIWLNVSELTKLKRFSTLTENMMVRQKPWRSWYEGSNPENAVNPFEQASGRMLSQFHRLLLIRAFCPDRILSQSQKYIAESLGKEFLQPIITNFSELVGESSPVTPMMCLLSMGSDPTPYIVDLAKKSEITLHSVSMGQGQEVLARALYRDVMKDDGGWLLIQNSHLALDYMAELAAELIEKEKTQEYPQNTRIWITSAPDEKYPNSLLQMSIKYTNEAPTGIKAGLKQTYGNLPQEILDYSNSKWYLSLIYAISFMHTIIQERRKYGPIGWNIPYEFNSSDWMSSCSYVQNLPADTEIRRNSIDWTAIRYMLSEVHYGGRVTDSMDKRLLIAFTEMWFANELLEDDFEFHPGFPVVKLKTKERYLDYIRKIDEDEGPETCGLHRNIEINYNVMVVEEILDTILAVQPKEAIVAMGGETREAQVVRQVEELLKKLPKPFDGHKVEEKLTEMGQLDPMAIFLRQEINAMQTLLTAVQKNLQDLLLAIDGMIVMSAALQDSMDSLYDGMIPKVWEKVSWPTTDKLGYWFANLLKRVEFLHSWCFNGRPNLFWFGGLFNPNGFLTAIRQEGVLRHRDWPLDTVRLDSEVLTVMPSDCRKAIREGVLMYGLVLEGAGWDRKNAVLCELPPKVVHTQMPVFHVYAVSGKTTAHVHDSYECPVYRTTKRQQCVTAFKLRTMKRPKEVKETNWILRGTALITK